ncbi:TerB family tellurite resistance protein [Algoriphagus aquimarinus]|uniref:Zinc-ribbon domain-containing protein n=1 Tax=Algoriphagus aquimarinus TaxID=237018 RepID=A0A5C7AVQ8_9BACT|nr:TerB family tellurite resistance protein [Algoriphagus aquimarinus]TXE12357.1 zinc-ribbon domain-containing protein [Algoriphagus aquimarinus]
MIIYGTKGVTITTKKGQFLCPNCNRVNKYRHKKVKRFFHLYWVPIIPLNTEMEFVECSVCSATYETEVLDYKINFNDGGIQSIFEQAIQKAMIQILLADGEINTDELKMVHLIINRFSYNDISLADLDSVVRKLEVNQEPISKYLTAIAPLLNDREKEGILNCGLNVASSDGKVDDNELSVILEIANSLGVSQTRLKELMQISLPN